MIETVQVPNGADSMIHQGGMGAEAPAQEPRKRLRCNHRWALVTRRAMADKPRARFMFIQCCRWCGTFRASGFSPRIKDGRIYVDYHIKYLKAEEGLKTVIFEFPEEA